jgi:hypothetical protein
MFLDDFHDIDGNRVRIDPHAASRFAREIAGDFNPIHDPGTRRFCVPGDLLCALVLRHYGLSRRMTFRFRGMVGEDATLIFPPEPGDTFAITDERDRPYLEVERSGPATRDAALIEPFVRSYVAFSGQSFPHILQPLLERHGVMFNPDRPLVIYENMGFTLDAFMDGEPVAEFADATLDVHTRHADARVHFDIRVGEQRVGHGSKQLMVRGLRPYDHDHMQAMMVEYERRRTAFRDSN